MTIENLITLRPKVISFGLQNVPGSQELYFNLREVAPTLAFISSTAGYIPEVSDTDAIGVEISAGIYAVRNGEYLPTSFSTLFLGEFTDFADIVQQLHLSSFIAGVPFSRLRKLRSTWTTEFDDLEKSGYSFVFRQKIAAGKSGGISPASFAISSSFTIAGI